MWWCWGFAGGMLDVDLLERDEEDLVDLAHDGLAPLLGLRERPFLTRVYRLWRASLQSSPGIRPGSPRSSGGSPIIPASTSPAAPSRVGIPDNVADTGVLRQDGRVAGRGVRC